MSILEVRDVSIRYITGDFKEIGLKEYITRKITNDYRVNEFWADKDISFTLEKGDMLGIIGTNGAGKSTLLKVISGIMEPTRGSFHREGNIAALLELGSGFDGDLTVRENTYLRGAMLGYSKKFMDETYDQIIAFAELEEFQNWPFKQLSSGMKSRLAFSIASLVKPDILILDEVLSVGDGAFRKKSEEKMRKIIEGGATTILVSHSLNQIRELCNKVLWLHKGKQIVFSSNVEEICDQYQKFLLSGESMIAQRKIKDDTAEDDVINDKAPLSKKQERKARIHMENSKTHWGRLLPFILLAFTLCVFGPLEIYMSNSISFPFKFHELLPGIFLMFISVLDGLILVTYFFKKSIVWESGIFGLAIAFYIQGNWMFVDYGEMDGTAIDWSSFGTWPFFNTVIWIFLLLTPIILCICIPQKENLKKYFRSVSLAILAVQCITLSTLMFAGTPYRDRDYYVARDDKILELSSDKNIVVMLFDGFQSSYFQQVITDMPETQNIFENFVFFDNALGTSLYSEEGSATILTGNQLQADLPYQENVDKIYKTSKFFPALEKNNYDVRYYISTKMVSGIQNSNIKNVLDLPTEKISWYKIQELMNRIVLFRYSPHILKYNFWFSYEDIDSLKSERKLDIPEFGTSDSTFNQELLDGKLSASLGKNAYRVYYFRGVHPPYVLDENANDVQYEQNSSVIDYVEDIHENPMMYHQAVGSIRIIANFIQALKDAGIYDKTNIVITADHGWQNRYNPILLIKSPNTKGEFTISHAPISYISDFEPTIMSLIDDSYSEKTVFDYTDESKRERSLYIYSINAADRSYNSRETWYVGPADEVISENLYTKKTDSEIQYKINEDIIFTDANDGRRYFEMGISHVENDFAWSLNKHGRMVLSIDSISSDLVGEFQFKGIFAPPQRLLIRCGDLILFDEEISSVENPIRFVIPKSCIEDGKLVLNLEYPDAISPYDYAGAEDIRKLAFRFYRIRFYPAESQQDE